MSGYKNKPWRQHAIDLPFEDYSGLRDFLIPLAAAVDALEAQIPDLDIHPPESDSGSLTPESDPKTKQE